MSVSELLRTGRLADATAAQTAVVKAQPLDVDARYLLFALLGFAGEWERAGRQLDALAHQDAQLAAGARIYVNLLASEAQRRAALAGKAEPLTPPDAGPHVAERLAALAALRAGDAAGAARRLEAAVAQQPELRGRCNGQPLAALRDLDDALGSVLEVFAGGRYLWLPWEHVRRLEVAPPSHLLDLLWLPAQLEDVRGTAVAVHLPVLYADSAAAADEAVKLGRLTEWLEAGEGILRGRGQRVLAHAAAGADAAQEMSLLDLRTLELEPPA